VRSEDFTLGNFPVGSIAGVPVAVSFTYLILIGYYMVILDPMTAGIWTAVITVSLMVHEFGHALMARKYQLNPRVLLWGMGGLCFHDPAAEDRDDALIIIAGPGAGLILGVITLIAYQFVGGGWPTFARATSVTDYVFAAMVYANIYWSLLNLLPLYPLDGGQLFRLFVLRKAKSVASAEDIVRKVGAAISVCGLLYGYSIGSTFWMILSAFLIWQNVQHMIGGRGGEAEATGRPARRSASPEVRENLNAGWEALNSDNPREAARQGHVVRSYNRMSKGEAAEMWTLLGLATTELGEYDEALAYLERAPDSADVLAARKRCQTGLAG
jgi:stage IV sporulation protein FB